MIRSSKIIVGIIVGIIIIIGSCIGLIVFINRGTIFPAPQTRSISDFYTAIDKNMPTLTNASGRVYTIVSDKKLTANWYDISIETTDQSIAPSLKSHIIIFDPYQSANYMQIQAGPETTFSRTELINDSIPMSVVNIIVKEQL